MCQSQQDDDEYEYSWLIIAARRENFYATLPHTTCTAHLKARLELRLDT